MLQTEISSLPVRTELPTSVEPESLLSTSSPQEVAISFVVPAVCFAVVTSFALFDLKAEPNPVGERA